MSSFFSKRRGKCQVAEVCICMYGVGGDILKKSSRKNNNKEKEKEKSICNKPLCGKKKKKKKKKTLTKPIKHAFFRVNSINLVF